MKRERGEYRPIYEALVDGPQFQALSPAARLCLFAIKLKSGACGMRSIPGVKEALREWTGLSAKAVHGALIELHDGDWVRIDRSVVWVVRGLEFEPTMDASNTKQRTHIQRSIDALPSVAIVAAFKERYRQWFDGSGDSPPHSPSEGHTEGHTIAPRSTSTINNPPPPPPPLLIDTRAAEASAIALTVAANQAVEAKWGARTNPFIATGGQAHELAVWVQEQSIPVEFAQRSIVRQVEGKRGDPPGSMSYFRKGIDADWSADKARRDAAAADPIAPLDRVIPQRRNTGSFLDLIKPGDDDAVA